MKHSFYSTGVTVMKESNKVENFSLILTYGTRQC